MGGFIRRWLITLIAVFVAAFFLRGSMTTSDFTNMAIFAAVLSLLNVFVRPVLLLFTLPFNILTLGLFTLVVNALVFWAATFVFNRVAVDGFVTAFIAALVISVVSAVLSKVFP